MKKVLVISAVNFVEGGGLSILREAVSTAFAQLGDTWQIKVLVHNRSLIQEKGVEVIEFPLAKSSWLVRLYYEWFGFRKHSRQWNVDLWLSLHDITPRVHAKSQALYYHNSTPFYRLKFLDIRLDFKFTAFNLFYLLPCIPFIKRNQAVIVQQDCLRSEFKKKFPDLNIVVAHPSLKLEPSLRETTDTNRVNIFLYPTLPRTFKNCELLCEAGKLLQQKLPGQFEIRITISPLENRYSKWLYSKYGDLPFVRFIGRLTREQMVEEYKKCSTVVFPSRLESWGLPISEAKTFQKNLLVSDLPYAHETVKSYGRVSFIASDDPLELAQHMQAIVEQTWNPKPAIAQPPSQPFAGDWRSLWSLLSESSKEL